MGYSCGMVSKIPGELTSWLSTSGAEMCLSHRRITRARLHHTPIMGAYEILYLVLTLVGIFCCSQDVVLFIAANQRQSRRRMGSFVLKLAVSVQVQGHTVRSVLKI